MCRTASTSARVDEHRPEVACVPKVLRLLGNAASRHALTPHKAMANGDCRATAVLGTVRQPRRHDAEECHHRRRGTHRERPIGTLVGQRAKQQEAEEHELPHW